MLMAGCGTSSNNETTTGQTTVTIVTKSLPAGVYGQTYGAAIQAVNGVAPYTYSVTSGTLPAGLTLSGSVIEGVPTSVVADNITITVTDSMGNKVSAGYTVAINAPS